MIHSLRAFVWLRWRLLANGIRGGQRRDTLERVSRALALAVPIIIIVLSLGSVLAIGAVGLFGGQSVASGLTEAPFVVAILRAVLLGAFGLLMLFTLASPVQSALGRYTRLLLLPISHRALHIVEVVTGLADPWVAFLIPGLLMFAVGLGIGGRPGAGAVAATAGLLLLAVLATFGATVGMLVSWLLRDRRRGEMVTFLAILAFSLATLLPMLFDDDRREERRQRATSGAQAEPAQDIDSFDRSLPLWTRALPSELYGRAVRAGLEQRPLMTAVAMAGLLAQAALFFWASSAVHARLIGTTTGGRGRRRDAAATQRLWRVPGLSSATTAVALAQARTALRTVRGRLAVVLPGVMFAVLVMVFRRVSNASETMEAILSSGYILVGIGLVFAVQSLQPFTMNLFGSDRAGLTLQFLAPITDLQLVRGKLLGCGLVFVCSALVCVAGALAVSPNGAPGLWVGALMGGAVTYLLVAPASVWLSALFPKPADVSRAGSAADPHVVPALIGMVLVVVAAAPSGLLLWLTLSPLGRPGLVLPVMSGWMAIAIALVFPLLPLAARAVGARRENLALVAQGR